MRINGGAEKRYKTGIEATNPGHHLMRERTQKNREGVMWFGLGFVPLPAVSLPPPHTHFEISLSGQYTPLRLGKKWFLTNTIQQKSNLGGANPPALRNCGQWHDRDGRVCIRGPGFATLAAEMEKTNPTWKHRFMG